MPTDNAFWLISNIILFALIFEYNVPMFFKKSILLPTKIRGYANEVGESFRPIIDVKLVRASYGLAFFYVLADTADKAWKAKKKSLSNESVVIQAGDAFLWQCMASIALPGFTINRICAGSTYILEKYPKVPYRGWLTVAIGLASIPFIIKPIDKVCDHFMDVTYRRVFDMPAQ